MILNQLSMNKARRITTPDMTYFPIKLPQCLQVFSYCDFFLFWFPLCQYIQSMFANFECATHHVGSLEYAFLPMDLCDHGTLEISFP